MLNKIKMAMNYPDYVQQLKSTDQMELFCQKFDCRIEDSREYNQYVRQVPCYRDFYDSTYDMETKVVPMKAIHLTVNNLARLVAEQEHMLRMQQDAEQGKRMWIKEREDAAVRAGNTAVERAYRNYQMLLELAR